MTNTCETVKELNKRECVNASIEGWSAWYEGEEGWGIDDNDDDDDK